MDLRIHINKKYVQRRLEETCQEVGIAPKMGVWVKLINLIMHTLAYALFFMWVLASQNHIPPGPPLLPFSMQFLMLALVSSKRSKIWMCDHMGESTQHKRKDLRLVIYIVQRGHVICNYTCKIKRYMTWLWFNLKVRILFKLGPRIQEDLSSNIACPLLKLGLVNWNMNLIVLLNIYEPH